MNLSSKDVLELGDPRMTVSVDHVSGAVTISSFEEKQQATAFYLSNPERLDELQKQKHLLTPDAQKTLAALVEVADVGKWLVAHAVDRDNLLRLCITGQNVRCLPPEEFFLLLVKSNPL